MKPVGMLILLSNLQGICKNHYIVDDEMYSMILFIYGGNEKGFRSALGVCLCLCLYSYFSVCPSTGLPFLSLSLYPSFSASLVLSFMLTKHQSVFQIDYIYFVLP